MELRDYLKALRKGWLIIVVCLLAGVAVSAAFTLTQKPSYVAKTELFVSVQADAASTAGGAANLQQGSAFAMQAVNSYASVATSSRVLGEVIDKLNLKMTPGALASSVTATSQLNTVLLDISVANGNPKLAAKIANAVGTTTADVVQNDLTKPSGSSQSLIKISTIQQATVPTSPASPSTTRNVGMGLLIGLVIGVAVALLRSVLDTRIHGLADIEGLTDTPVLGAIAIDPDSKQRPLVMQTDPRSPRAEAYRSLRTNLQFLDVGGRPRSYVVTSSVPGEGKSTTSANLAIALAETGAKVTLIDGDLRAPRVADYMGIEGGVGLSDVLIGRVDLEDAMQRWGRGQLYVLPSGRIPPNPSELLGSKAMVRLLAMLTEECDYVIVDAPPLLLVTDAAVLSRITGGAVIVASAGSTRKPELEGAIRALERVDGLLSGVVVNRLPLRGPDSYGYGTYGYGVQHDADDAEAPSGPGRRRAA